MNLHNDADIARSPDFPMSLLCGDNILTHRSQKENVLGADRRPHPRLGSNPYSIPTWSQHKFFDFHPCPLKPLVIPTLSSQLNWRHSP